MKKIVSVVMLFFIAVTSLGCIEPTETKQVLKFAIGQSQPFFTTADKVLRPASSNTPEDGESISKTIELEIANVTKIALEFISDNDVIDGLMFSVDSGLAQSFIPGVFYTKNVTKTATSHSVILKVWLSHETPSSQAGKSYTFTIKALAE